jgi:hypothetical protein
MHLTPEELIDLAEGTQNDASVPHVMACAACRRQLVEARAMLASVADVEVPEPSPLFWDHLSRRVSDAVAAEGAPHGSWLVPSWMWTSAAPLAVVTMVVTLVAALGPRFITPREPNRTATTAAATATVASTGPAVPTASSPGELLSDSLQTPDDLSLELVAELTDAAGINGDAGLATSGSAEHAVTHLSGSELQELGRILQQELAHAGA